MNGKVKPAATPGAERSRKYRENLAKQQADLAARAAWAPPLAGGTATGPGPASRAPVHETEPQDGGDPMRWKAVPLVPPDIADEPTGEGGAPTAATAATPVVDDPSKKPLSPEELKVRAGGFVSFVSMCAAAGMAALDELVPLAMEHLQAKHPALAATLSVVKVESFDPEPTLAIVGAAAEDVAIRYGLLVGKPSNEMIVGTAIVGGLGAKVLVHVLKKRKASRDASRDDKDDDASRDASERDRETEATAKAASDDWGAWMKSRGAA